MRIDYYFSVISPFGYLAGDRLERITERHGAHIAYKPVDVAGLFARTGGQPLAERPQARRDYRLQELRRQAKKHGMPIIQQPAHFPTNPAPASYAIIAAQADGTGDTGALVRNILTACWAEERDIAEDAVIRDCLERAGFEAGLADRGLLAGAETYARNLEEAVEVGVFGAPFYIVGDERFWGQDRLEDLDLFLAGKL
jgi:2-hydroxychromene-2-carboxylate isomerase